VLAEPLGSIAETSTVADPVVTNRDDGCETIIGGGAWTFSNVIEVTLETTFSVSNFATK
jgi:hypothetical protein